MKYLLVIFMLAFSGIAIPAVSAKTICYEDVPGTGNFDWDSAHESCPIGGAFCKKTVSITNPKEVEVNTSPTGGGIFITTTFGGMTFNVTNDPVYGTFTSVHDGKSYTFGEGEYIFIDESDEYPALNGLGVSLEGITTDSNGEYTVFIPIN
jgi:hypothetical protein